MCEPSCLLYSSWHSSAQTKHKITPRINMVAATYLIPSIFVILESYRHLLKPMAHAWNKPFSQVYMLLHFLVMNVFNKFLSKAWQQKMLRLAKKTDLLIIMFSLVTVCFYPAFGVMRVGLSNIS